MGLGGRHRFAGGNAGCLEFSPQNAGQRQVKKLLMPVNLEGIEAMLQWLSNNPSTPVRCQALRPSSNALDSLKWRLVFHPIPRPGGCEFASFGQ